VQVKLSPIISWRDAEIDVALRHYFSKPNTLSTIYWPRALRNFLKLLVERLHQSNDLLCQLQQDEAKVKHLLEELAKPTSHYIRVPQRKLAHLLLRQIRLDPNAKLVLRKPSATTPSSPDGVWPPDINGLDDLKDSLSSWNMRGDVKRYLVALLSKVSEDEPFKLHYVGFTPDTLTKQYPIKVEVSPTHVADVQQFLKSESAKMNQAAALLPEEVVEVVGLPNIASSVKVSEEGFHTSGSPWKEGTLGALFKCGDEPYGVTCAHVHKYTPPKPTVRSNLHQEVNGETEPIYTQNDAELDVAFVKLKEDGQVIFNLMPLSLHERIDCVLGENVYKIGSATGLTIGRLASTSVDFRCPTSKKLYENVIEVEWVDKCPFGFHGDCGAIYCVIRKGCFVPIAIHRTSGDNTSYGSNFFTALDRFQEYLDSDKQPMFINGPYAYNRDDT